MPFNCLRCGECCSAMGEVHDLERQPDGNLEVRNRYTGEVTRVVLDPDKAGLIDSPAITGACPLFRRDAEGHGVCPVHETWPTVCAEYACWRILVLDQAGRRAARVMAWRHVAVDDPVLEAVLASARSALARAADDAAWDAAFAGIVESAGYRVVK